MLKSIGLSYMLNGLRSCAWFCNIIYWLFGKWWFTVLCRSFKCWHISSCNIKITLVNITNFIRKGFKYWEALKLTALDVSFPKLQFSLDPLPILSLAMSTVSCCLVETGSLHSFLRTILCQSFFQVKTLIHERKNKTKQVQHTPQLHKCFFMKKCFSFFPWKNVHVFHVYVKYNCCISVCSRRGVLKPQGLIKLITFTTSSRTFAMETGICFNYKFRTVRITVTTSIVWCFYLDSH